MGLENGHRNMTSRSKPGLLQLQTPILDLARESVNREA